MNLISLFRLLHQFLVLFVQFGEMSSDELAEGTVVEPESSCQRFHAFGCRSIKVQGLLVFSHAMVCHRTTAFCFDHTLPGIEFRLMLFQVLPETFRMQTKLGGDLCRRKPAFFQPGNGIRIFGSGGRIVSSHG
ncbi:hypothetical protein ACIXU3_01465 [Bacteroides fragilis]